MYVVIFHAKTRKLDAEYLETARLMRETALAKFGCIDIHSVIQGQDEVTLSYWLNEESIRAWKTHPEHILVQQVGRERWYESYSVQIAQVSREYRKP